VTLRTDVHIAFDSIAPLTGGMAERVAETVRTGAPIRERRNRLMNRLRVPLSLVAVLVIVAIVAAVLVVGRLMQQQTTVHRPQSTPTAEVINQAELAQLEAVPLALPVMRATDRCVESPPIDGSTGRYNLGHVAFQGASHTTTDDWGITYHVNVYVSKQVTGLVLIRGRDLKTQQPMLWSGDYAYGPSGDSTRPQFLKELVIDMGSQASSGEKQHLVHSALTAGHSDCFGLQIDGRGFSEHFTSAA
jgi:hypothetical protein